MARASEIRKKEQRALQKRFLEIFYEMGTIERAATMLKEESGSFSRRTVYNWMDRDKSFANKLEKVKPLAKANYVGVLEHEAHRRAVEGIDKPIYYQGILVDKVKEYSDTLLIVLLKANAPEKYRERTEVTGADGGPVMIKEVEVRLNGHSDAS